MNNTTPRRPISRPSPTVKAEADALIAEAETKLALAEDLNNAAENLNNVAKVLNEMIYNTNALFERLFNYAQETDAKYAAKMNAIKSQIEAYFARIGEIRDSFGNKFLSDSSVFHNPNNFTKVRGKIEGILRQPPGQEISAAEFGIVAWAFVRMDNAEGREYFLNMLASPIQGAVFGEQPRPVSIPIPIAVPKGMAPFIFNFDLTSPPQWAGDTAFTFCQDRVAALQMAFNYQISRATEDMRTIPTTED